MMTDETRDEQIDRLRQMAEDDGLDWDLSPNDRAAIRMAVDVLTAAPVPAPPAEPTRLYWCWKHGSYGDGECPLCAPAAEPVAQQPLPLSNSYSKFSSNLIDTAAQQPEAPPTQDDDLLARAQLDPELYASEMLIRIERDAECIRALEAEAKFQHQAADDMLRITADLSDQLAASRERERALREALRELVALKDQKTLIETEIAAANEGGYCRSIAEVRREQDYKARKPAAWEAARRALATPDSAASPTGGEG